LSANGAGCLANGAGCLANGSGFWPMVLVIQLMVLVI